MKIFVLRPNEDWVVDRFQQEWLEHNRYTVTNNPFDADILWLMAGWCWNHIPQQLLAAKKVVLTVHHIDPDKFDDNAQREFAIRDQFVDWYHVPCSRTGKFVRRLTRKNIFCAPFWVNAQLWHELPRDEMRSKHGLPTDSYIIGSFQRDTEGFDLATPKLAKGPDVFCDVVDEIRKKKSNVHVLLAGWRRQYVMSRLDNMGITSTYIERPGFDVVNELYNALDLYVVGSRHEGGPQAVFECAATRTPIISTPVGYAESILGPEGNQGVIYNIPEDGDYSIVHTCIKRVDTEANYERVEDLFIPRGMKTFTRFFDRIMS